MDRYHVYSTDDLVNWRDEGELLRADQVTWGRKEGGFMWAPDCAYKDGKYFFYFPHPSGTDWNQTTVPLAPGTTNTIQLTGGNGGINVDCILIDPL